LPAPVAKLRTALRRWYRLHRRRLPWRERPSLYGTVVSEFMLQQTQVKTVLPYYERWLERFPDFAALAAATEAEVLRSWEGLGYYTRARHLHRLARMVAARTQPPQSAAEWQTMPGVGPYTAAAIASIGQGERTACVDGNVVRVLARLMADETAWPAAGAAVKRFGPMAAALLDPRHPGDHNQAMMELGATVCTRHRPACGVCPLRQFCRAAATGLAEQLPRIARAATEQRTVIRVWWVRGACLLLHRAASGSRRLASLHELPTPEILGWPQPRVGDGTRVLVRRVRRITKYRIEETIVAAPAGAEPPADPVERELHWVPLEALDDVVFSGPHRRWVQELLMAGHGTEGGSGPAPGAAPA
jgi:A/G-specific adenine glycosylase